MKDNSGMVLLLPPKLSVAKIPWWSEQLMWKASECKAGKVGMKLRKRTVGSEGGDGSDVGPYWQSTN